MGEFTQINIRVDSEIKEEWMEYVEESAEFTSLTGLIRTGVQKEINGGKVPTERASQTTINLEGLRTEIKALRHDVAQLKDPQADDEEERDLSEFANRVRDALVKLPKPNNPVEVPDDVDDRQDFHRQQAASVIVAPDNESEWEEEGKNPQTLAAIADRVDSTPERVKDAIGLLQDEFLPVVEVELNGQTHYFMDY